MKFSSKLEMMSFALIKLNQIREQERENKAIEDCIKNIKEAFENHEQDPTIICNHLKDILPDPISDNAKEQIKTLIEDIGISDYKQTPQEKFDNPLARRAESELFAHLLVSPTALMMESVKLVSKEILKALQLSETDNPKVLEKFLACCIKEDEEDTIICGAFQQKPLFNDVKKILEENNSNQLAEIIYIHYKFGLKLSRDIPIYASRRDKPPVGKLAEIVNNYKSEKGFFYDITQYGSTGTDARTYISGPLMYKSELYSKIGSRGRKGDLDMSMSKLSGRLSLMRADQPEYEINLPERKEEWWVPDCKGQDPDFNSPYVLDLINNDALYVSGPSGMTSLLLAQMEFMANLETIALKQNYLNAVTAYIVGAGFHSLHEVIGPAQYALDLVPRYTVFVPGKEKSPQEEKLPAAPQYNVFFKQQCDLDPEFKNNREAAWQRYLDFFQNIYIPTHSAKKLQELLKREIFRSITPQRIAEALDILMNINKKNFITFLQSYYESSKNQGRSIFSRNKTDMMDTVNKNSAVKKLLNVMQEEKKSEEFTSLELGVLLDKGDPLLNKIIDKFINIPELQGLRDAMRFDFQHFDMRIRIGQNDCNYTQLSIPQDQSPEDVGKTSTHRTNSK